MEAPAASCRRRVTSLLEGPTETTLPQGGLPWTLDMGSALFKLNLTLRGVPRSQHNRYVAEGLPLPPPDASVMGKGAFPGRFTGGADAAFFRSYPCQLPVLGEMVDLPSHVPEIPQRLSAAHRKPPSQVNLSWRAACHSEMLTRQQASLLSHASWWNFALQRRLLSLSENMFNMEPEEGTGGPHCDHQSAGTEPDFDVTVPATAERCGPRPDTSSTSSSLLRAAPLQSPDLFGPNQTWTTEDEQAKTLGGGRPQTFRRPVQQEERKAFAPSATSARAAGRGGKAGKGWRKRKNPQGPSNLPGSKSSRGGSQQQPRRK